MPFIVVPAYNEATSIGRVIRGLLDYGFNQIIVVDDGSIDNTAAVAKAAGATVLRHAINRGQGAALQTGNDYTLAHGATQVVHFDADGQFDPADIQSALDVMKKEKCDALLGSRFMDARSTVPWFKKHILLPLARIVNFAFTGLWLTDGQNGFRILSRAALQKVVITQDGMAHASEIIRLVAKNKLAFREVPVRVTYHTYGQGLLGGVTIVKDMLLHLFTRK